MEKKMTVKEQFVEVAKILRDYDYDDLADFIDGRVAILDKKTAGKKPTEQQVANAALKTDMVEYMTTNGGRYRAGELAKQFDTSTTRVSALLKQLVDGGEVVRELEKKVAYFSVA